MDFFKRFSNALFVPKDVLQYRGDPWWKALIVFFILLFILIIPATIVATQNLGLTYEKKLEIRRLFNGDPDIPYRIVNGVLIHDQSDQSQIYKKRVDTNIYVVMTTAESIDRETTASGITIVFRTDGVYIAQSVISYRLFDYGDYPELNGIDFSDATTLSNIAFWEKVFSVAEQEIAKFRPLAVVANVIVTIFSAAFSIIVISLILALFQSFQVSSMIRFGHLWKLCIYLMTPYAFGNTLSALFNIGILYYAGFIATTIYAIILGQTILKNNTRKD